MLGVHKDQKRTFADTGQLFESDAITLEKNERIESIIGGLETV